MERTTTVCVREGLHARPAARFAKLAKSFQCDIELLKASNGNGVIPANGGINAKSPVKLMLLSVKEGDAVTVRTAGTDALDALDALIAFLEDPTAGLEADAEDAPTIAAPVPPPPPSSIAAALADAEGIQGIAASEGVAFGPAFAYFPADIATPERRLAADEIDAEIARYRAAVAAVQARMQAPVSGDMSAADQGIITALSDIAGDETMTAEIVSIIRRGSDAVTAVRAVASNTAEAFARMGDSYFNARADDVAAIGRQICLALLGKQDVGLQDIPRGSILIAEDIGAFDLARAPLKRIAGIVCGRGAATSHIAIIARAHGIPAVLGLGDQIEALRDVREIALDGHTGTVHGDPEDTLRARYTTRLNEAKQERDRLEAFRTVVPRRSDGTVIEIAANLGSLEEVETAREAGAMGVGLFRTELLFMRQKTLPSEEFQVETYTELVRAFAPHPVIVRTLDIGGDKPVAGIQFPHEDNPFLGWRGVRMCLDRPDIFKPQLRALLRAGVHGNLKIMLPMVSDVGEVRRTRALIEECRAELKAEGIAHAPVPLGVMIETPAAVFIAPQLAQEVAFFSIGTNDLTQYVMAADRLNPAVASLNDVANVAVMAAIEMTAKAGVAAGIMVGMCGEAAGHPDLIPHFIRMGLTELSMSPTLIPRAKKRVMEMALPEDHRQAS